MKTRKTINTTLSERESLIGMTDSAWQKQFYELRQVVNPSKDKNMKTSYPVRVNGRCEKSNCGDTQWQNYCRFINDILKNIRLGERDYCYHIYQIKELLRFEHDKLVTEWLPEHQCFEVSLRAH